MTSELRGRGRPRTIGTHLCGRCTRMVPKIRVRWPDGNICGACFTAAVNTHGICAHCNTERLLPGRSPSGERICGDCAGITTNLTCDRCQKEGERIRGGFCACCVLTDDLTAILHPNNPPDLRLQRLIRELSSTNRPQSIRTWMRGTAPAEILHRVGTRELALSHDRSTANRHLARSSTCERCSSITRSCLAVMTSGWSASRPGSTNAWSPLLVTRRFSSRWSSSPAGTTYAGSVRTRRRRTCNTRPAPPSKRSPSPASSYTGSTPNTTPTSTTFGKSTSTSTGPRAPPPANTSAISSNNAASPDTGEPSPRRPGTPRPHPPSPAENDSSSSARSSKQTRSLSPPGSLRSSCSSTAHPSEPSPASASPTSQPRQLA